MKWQQLTAEQHKKTYHEMRIPERDVPYIVLSVLLLTLILRLPTNWNQFHYKGTRHKMDHTQVNLIQL